jgi:hypothetical protein
MLSNSIKGIVQGFLSIATLILSKVLSVSVILGELKFNLNSLISELILPFNTVFVPMAISG